MRDAMRRGNGEKFHVLKREYLTVHRLSHESRPWSGEIGIFRAPPLRWVPVFKL